MKVLAVASEIYPLVKTGGLADVAGALPPALAGHGIAVRTLVPGYPAVIAALAKPRAIALPDLFGHPARLLAAKVAGLDLLVLDMPALFDRPGGPYADSAGADHADNWMRFAALGRTGAAIAAGAVPGWAPALVHAHDWQAAMTLAFLRYAPGPATPSVMTVHNLAFQGRFPLAIFPELGLPAEAASVYGVEYYGGVGFLKAGLAAADAITTVSPTYAREITTAASGMGLEGLLAARGADLHGILNGIDSAVWSPAADAALPAPYTHRHLPRRRHNRQAIERRFGLHPHPGPLYCVVSRLTWQKGMDVLADVLDDLVASGGSLAVLGSGDAPLEGAFLAAAARHPGRIGVTIGYDEAVSHLLQGGADAVLIPSRFEPCGLTQLYGLAYGCVPVVARTGGLADTVIDANEAALAAGVATGFVTGPPDADALRHAFARVAATFADAPLWATIQKRGMREDNNWSRSAARYATLYRELIERGETG